MAKIFCLVLLFLVISVSYLYTNAFADSNSTKQIPMFPTINTFDQSNTYHDKANNFSFTPPQNWDILNVPASVQNNALVMFSNGNHTGLATLAIFYKSIPQQLVTQLETFSDTDLLSETSNELSYNGKDFQTKVLQAGLQRYQDGFIIKEVTLTQYPNDTTSIQNEHLIFFLNDGREYTLLFTCKSQDFNREQKYFEASVDTFYVAPNGSVGQTKAPQIGPPVPEFGPLAGMIIVVSIIGAVVISKKFRFYFSE